MSKKKRSGVLFTPLFTAALIVLTLIILLTLFANLIAPYDPDMFLPTNFGQEYSLV